EAGDKQGNKIDPPLAPSKTYPTIDAAVKDIEKSEQKPEISPEKLDWMKEVGIKEFDKPMKFYAPRNHHLCSEEYMANTPLEKIKAGYESTLPVEDDLLNKVHETIGILLDWIQSKANAASIADTAALPEVIKGTAELIEAAKINVLLSKRN
uniref:hypothetical protein n=1 Tax=Paenibacillus senegalimassiliensis TaxID=1737426 RepID=UPI000AA3320B